RRDRRSPPGAGHRRPARDRRDGLGRGRARQAVRRPGGRLRLRDRARLPERPPPSRRPRGLLAHPLRPPLTRRGMEDRNTARELGALRTGLVFSSLLCVVQLVGGYLTNSLALNAFVALRLREHRDHSLNLRGAYLHVVSDLLGSVGALGAALVILLTGWYTADPLASVLIAVLILLSSWNLVREAVDVLMEA